MMRPAQIAARSPHTLPTWRGGGQHTMGAVTMAPTAVTVTPNIPHLHTPPVDTRLPRRVSLSRDCSELPAREHSTLYTKLERTNYLPKNLCFSADV